MHGCTGGSGTDAGRSTCAATEGRSDLGSPAVRAATETNGRVRLAAMADLKTEQIIALLLPIVVIQLGLIIAALYDLEKDERRVRGGSKLVWVLIIVFVNVIGPIVYFTAGREDT
jgi:hypothetical protein